MSMELDYKERFKENVRLIQWIDESGVFSYMEDKLGKTIMYKRIMEFTDGILKLIDKIVENRTHQLQRERGDK